MIFPEGAPKLRLFLNTEPALGKLKWPLFLRSFMYFLHSSWILDFSSGDFFVSLNVADATNFLCSENLYSGISVSSFVCVVSGWKGDFL